MLGAVALRAIKLNEYNDNFFNLMPHIFSYNRFTMYVRSSVLKKFYAHTGGVQKLFKRQIFLEHIMMALLVKRQDDLLAELKSAADEGFPRAKEEWERSVTAWSKYCMETYV